MIAVGSDPRRIEPTNVEFDLRESKTLVTGHAFSYYLSCHGGAFLMDVVCGCIGLLYALVAQRYRSLSLGHYCM